MEDWTEFGYYLVISQCKTDPIYQDLLRQCTAEEPAYLAILARLSLEERTCIERYVSLCAELDNRMAQLAYFCRPQQ